MELLFCSVSQSCPTPWDPMDYSTPGFPIPHHLLEFAQVHIHCIGDDVQAPHPLTPLHLLPSIFPSIGDFSNELSIHVWWSKHWSFTFSISPCSQYSGLISLKMGWFDLLAVQGTFRSLLQHHSSKVSILWHSVLFTVQLSQLYMTTGKTTAMTIQTFVGKIVSVFSTHCLGLSWWLSIVAVIKYISNNFSIDSIGIGLFENTLNWLSSGTLK